MPHTPWRSIWPLFSCPTATLPANSVNIGKTCVPDSPNPPKVSPVRLIFIDRDALRKPEIIENLRKTQVFQWFLHIRQHCCQIEKILPWGASGPSQWRPESPKMVSRATKMRAMSSKMGPETARSAKMGAQLGHCGPTCCSWCS